DRNAGSWRRLLRTALALLLVAMAKVPAGAQPVPIGVGVHITRTITDPGPQAETEELKRALADDLLRRLPRIRHWDFSLENPALHRAVVRLAVRDGGPNHVAVEIK